MFHQTKHCFLVTSKENNPSVSHVSVVRKKMFFIAATARQIQQKFCSMKQGDFAKHASKNIGMSNVDFTIVLIVAKLFNRMKSLKFAQLAGWLLVGCRSSAVSILSLKKLTT